MSDGDLDAITPLALAAQQGDRDALEALCRQLQHPMYRLALRFTGHPVDAEDAAQEVMVRIVTGLSTFEGRARFTTWAYTVAVRQLLRSRRRDVERSVRGPEPFGAFVDDHAADPAWEPEQRAEYDELCADVRLSCTYGMLLCLTREQRVAYLVGDLLGCSDVEGAEICGIRPPAFRQRLARARRTMRDLMGERCGLVRAANPCRCSHLVRASIDHGILDPARPAFARHRGVVLPIEVETLERAAAELDLAVAAVEVHRAAPTFVAPVELWARLAGAMPELLSTNAS
jgi:RNA polymerase sigma factor (sigma-70 family)